MPKEYFLQLSERGQEQRTKPHPDVQMQGLREAVQERRMLQQAIFDYIEGKQTCEQLARKYRVYTITTERIVSAL